MVWTHLSMCVYVAALSSLYTSTYRLALQPDARSRLSSYDANSPSFNFQLLMLLQWLNDVTDASAVYYCMASLCSKQHVCNMTTCCACFFIFTALFRLHSNRLSAPDELGLLRRKNAVSKVKTIIPLLVHFTLVCGKTFHDENNL